MKKCTKCLEDKPRSEFYKDNKAKDGLRSDCKSCAQDKSKQYYLKNKDRVIEASQQWSRENKDRVSESSKRYYLKNKDRIYERRRAWRLENKDEFATQQREYKYKMSGEQYQKLLEEQDYVCAICGKANANGQDLYVDHDHSCCSGSKSCGKCIRGLLCHKCNSALGLFDDSIESLNKAVEYRKKYSRKENNV